MPIAIVWDKPYSIIVNSTNWQSSGNLRTAQLETSNSSHVYGVYITCFRDERHIIIFMHGEYIGKIKYKQNISKFFRLVLMLHANLPNCMEVWTFLLAAHHISAEYLAYVIIYICFIWLVWEKFSSWQIVLMSLCTIPSVFCMMYITSCMSWLALGTIGIILTLDDGGWGVFRSHHHTESIWYTNIMWKWWQYWWGNCFTHIMNPLLSRI